MTLHTYVMARLVLWSEWRLRRDDGGLGYPRKSTFYRVPGSSHWSPEMETSSLEMDACVCALASDLRQVVLLEYTRVGTQETKARQCGISVRTYATRLTTAYGKLLSLLNESAAEMMG